MGGSGSQGVVARMGGRGVCVWWMGSRPPMGRGRGAHLGGTHSRQVGLVGHAVHVPGDGHVPQRVQGLQGRGHIVRRRTAAVEVQQWVGGGGWVGEWVGG